MSRRPFAGRPGTRKAFGTSAPEPASMPLLKGRFLVIALALVTVVGMVLLAESRLEAVKREAALAAQQQAAPPLREDRAGLLAGLFQGTIRDGVDEAEFDETPSFDRLIYHVRAMPKAEFSSHVTRRLDWTDSLARPELWRGEFVRFRGLVVKLEAVKLHHAADDVHDIYRGFVSQPDSTEMVAFDFVDVPPKVEAKRDVIDIEGVFYRTVSYESIKGVKRVVPYLIVRDLKVFEQDADPLTRFEGWKLGAVVAGSVAVALLLLRWSSRRSRRAAARAAAAPPANFHKTP